MKKLIVFIIFILFVFGVYYVKINSENEGDTFFYKEEFESLNREFWYVGEWKTLFAAYDKVKLSNGKIKLEADEIDKNPFLLSEPLDLKAGQILTVKRRIKISTTEESFTGGFAIIETLDKGLIPSALNGYTQGLGNGVVLIEYVRNYEEESERPGNDVFRILPRTWSEDHNQLVPSIFDSWFEETIIYNVDENRITYILDDESYIVDNVLIDQEGQFLVNEKVRLYMHGYGFGLGHAIEIDWVEISIE